MSYEVSIRNGAEENPMVFSARFSRSRSSLYLIAIRMLHCAELAEQAVKNCFLTASRNPPKFQYEGAFGCWVIRILMDEAVLLIARNNGRQATGVHLLLGRSWRCC